MAGRKVPCSTCASHGDLVAHSEAAVHAPKERLASLVLLRPMSFEHVAPRHVALGPRVDTWRGPSHTSSPAVLGLRW